MADEAEQDDLQYIQELNLFVDTILECVYEHTHADRKIIFSSFHPDIALLLNMKQPNYPVFFLTDAGTLPMADVRCNSIQEAIRFAKGADLLGIVTASEPILAAPRMAKVIKQTGLLLFTYGVLNNEVANAKAQQSYGVDAVIVVSGHSCDSTLFSSNRTSVLISCHRIRCWPYEKDCRMCQSRELP